METAERWMLLLQLQLRLLLQVEMACRRTKVGLQWQAGLLLRLVRPLFRLLTALQQILVCQRCLKRLPQLLRCQSALHCSW